MKSKDLIAYAEGNGFHLVRHGGNHDVYGKGSIMIPIPRHREIPERTAKGIMKQIDKAK